MNTIIGMMDGKQKLTYIDLTAISYRRQGKYIIFYRKLDYHVSVTGKIVNQRNFFYLLPFISKVLLD